MPKLKHTPSPTRDCYKCFETYFGGTDASRCEFCGGLLRLRPVGMKAYADLDLDEGQQTAASRGAG